MFFVRTDDNVKIAVEDLNPKGSKTVFFIHGWPLNKKSFEYQKNALICKDYRCISMDIRGFGDSDCPCGGYTYDRMAKDVHTVLNSLNPRNVTLCGFSMGGAVALRYCGNYKDSRICKLALLAAAAPVFTMRPDFPYGTPKEDVDEMIDGCCANRPKVCFDFCKRLFAINHGPEIFNWTNDLCLEASGIGSIGGLICLRDEDCRKDMAKVCIPCGIFHGRQDDVCPFELAKQMHYGIERSELYAFNDCGHAVYYDKLELFNRTFMEFLSK